MKTSRKLIIYRMLGLAFGFVFAIWFNFLIYVGLYWFRLSEHYDNFLWLQWPPHEVIVRVIKVSPFVFVFGLIIGVALHYDEKSKQKKRYQIKDKLKRRWW